MAREKKSAEEIRSIVQGLVDANREVAEDGAKIGVPLPYLHETDDQGCNWNMKNFQNGGGHMGAIEVIVDMSRAKYELV